ncbi:MAG: hypothetical protein IJ959_01620 [Clostridia bacterium]|nr:hypothetical protein [Clostridia bacterium]
MEDVEIEKALIKKAVGFQVEEVIEEFSIDENGNQVLTKRKKTTKNIPPDVSAIKILLAYYDEKTFDELNAMTDEELRQQRDLLLHSLQKFDEKELS